MNVRNRHIQPKTSTFGGGSPHEQKLTSELLAELIIKNHIDTTETKAERLKPVVERLVIFGKRGDRDSRKRAMSILQSKQAVEKLFDEVAPNVLLDEAGPVVIQKTTPEIQGRSFVKVEFAIVEFEKHTSKPYWPTSAKVNGLEKRAISLKAANHFKVTNHKGFEFAKIKAPATKTLIASTQVDKPLTEPSATGKIIKLRSGGHSLVLRRFEGALTLEQVRKIGISVGVEVRHYGDPNAWTLGTRSLRGPDDEPALVRIVRSTEPQEGYAVEVAWMDPNPSAEILAELRRNVAEIED